MNKAKRMRKVEGKSEPTGAQFLGLVKWKRLGAVRREAITLGYE